MKTFTVKLSLLFLSLLFISCGSDKSKKETPKTNEETSSKTDIDPVNTKEDIIYYVWVDNINVRATPNTNGKIVGTYTSPDLTFTGIQSENKDIIVLRSVVYEDHWLKVNTNDNKEGWVFGGAVKVEGEDVGNEIITDEEFDFIHFGKFDLTTWKNMGTRNEEAGDAETKTTTYSKDEHILAISKTDVGEYGYYHTYVLKDRKNNILKEREFNFVVDTGQLDTRTMELTEVVKDYTKKIKYTRTQKTSKHFMQMNAKPLMANGVWNAVKL